MALSAAEKRVPIHGIGCGEPGRRLLSPPKVVREETDDSRNPGCQGQATTPSGPSSPPEPHAGDGHQLVRLPPGKRNCVGGHDSRVSSVYECPACNVGLCPLCFANYNLSGPGISLLCSAGERTYYCL